MTSHADKIHKRAAIRSKKDRIGELLERINNIGTLDLMKVEDLCDTLNQLIELGATEKEVKEAFQINYLKMTLS